MTSNPGFDAPILNSHYLVPTCHWEFDEDGQPTQRIVDSRRKAGFVTPISCSSPAPSTTKSTPPKSSKIAVKVINHLGDEVMKVFRVEP